MQQRPKVHRIPPRVTARARRLRRDSSFPERLLWSKLRNRNLPEAKFRRQHAVGGFVVDFCCSERRLVIELDGRSHDTAARSDTKREEHLHAMRFTIVRFSNDEVIHNLGAVLVAIDNAIDALLNARAS